MINAEPVVTIRTEEGVYRWSNHVLDDSGDGMSGVNVIADFSISWGRSGIFESPQSQTLDIELLSRKGDTLHNRSLIGARITVAAVTDDPTGSEEITIYDGVITKQSLRPRSTTRITGDRAYYLCELECTSVRALLENSTFTDDEMPKENATKRAQRILESFDDKHGLISGAGVEYFPGAISNMNKVDGFEGETLAKMLDDIFQAFSATWDYSPDIGKLTVTPIRPHDRPVGIIMRPANRTHGDLIVDVINRNTNDDDYVHDASIPGAYSVSDLVVTKDIADQISEVSVEYPTHQSNDISAGSETITRKSDSELANYSNASMDIQIPYISENWATDIAENYIELSDLMRSRWTPSEMTFKSSIAGGLPAAGLSTLLVAWGNDTSTVTTGRYSTMFDDRPQLMQIIGGEIEYSRRTNELYGDWEITMQPAPIVEDVGYIQPVPWSDVPEYPDSDSGENLARNSSFTTDDRTVFGEQELDYFDTLQADAEISEDWASDGNTSLKVTGNGPWSTVTVSDTFMKTGFGKTYTVGVDIHVPEKLVGDLPDDALTIAIGISTDDNMNQTIAWKTSNSAENKSDHTERLVVTATIPDDPDMYSWWIDLFNGSDDGEVVYFDAISIQEGETSGKYKDTINVEWNTTNRRMDKSVSWLDMKFVEGGPDWLN